MPEITIITCSYNKPEYVADAINSVLKQTFTDFEYIILENSSDGKTRDVVHKFKDKRLKIRDRDFSSKERKRIYLESRLKNDFFPTALGKYIIYLADDDTLDPFCFEKHIKDFRKNKNHKANYHGYKITYLNSSQPQEIKPAIKTFGPHRSPRDRVDGGCVMFEKGLLEKISFPYFKCNWHDAHISDSLFLDKLSRVTVFYPINKILHTKRITRVSTHTFIGDNGVPGFYRPKYGWGHPNLRLE